ncbi:MAG: Trk system potassium transport protein TrkA [Syntrophobacteraceae bacterium CG2_30_61_12]|nr:MAG: Trk system potassium transport protein TrkA [Syntrophobacteraceae bacterium CG2_30_61_12]
MRVIVAGAGEVGFHIAQRLASEGKEVVVIDNHAASLKRVGEQLDVQTVLGSGSSPRILEEVGIDSTDLFLAVTDSDEVNLVACFFADALAPGITKLARIRDDDYSRFNPELLKRTLKIDKIINPEVEVVHTIEQLLAVPAAEEISDFAGGRIKLIGIRQKHYSFAGSTLIELRRQVGPARFLIAAISRENQLIIPSGTDTVENGDLIYIACETEQMTKVLALFGCRPEPVHRVMVIGGGNIGLRLARQLESKPYHVRLVEKDLTRCEYLAEQLKRAIILHGDGTDQGLLEEEDIRGMDVVITVTGDEENNVLISLLAKRLGAHRTITRINKFAYMPIVTGVGLNFMVSPRLSAINSILHQVRKGTIISTVSLRGEEAEVLEAVVMGESQLVGKTLNELDFPKGTLVLAVVTQEHTVIPSGTTRIEAGDRIIVLSVRANIAQLERDLSVKLEVS